MSSNSSLPEPTWEALTLTSRWSSTSTRGKAMVEPWGGRQALAAAGLGGCRDLVGRAGKTWQVPVLELPGS